MFIGLNKLAVLIPIVSGFSLLPFNNFDKIGSVLWHSDKNRDGFSGLGGIGGALFENERSGLLDSGILFIDREHIREVFFVVEKRTQLFWKNRILVFFVVLNLANFITKKITVCARFFGYYNKYDLIKAKTWGNQNVLINRISIWLLNGFCYNILQRQTPLFGTRT